MFTITPFAVFRAGNAAWVVKYKPLTLAFITASQIDSLVSSMDPFSKIPALLIRMSRPPKASIADITADLHPSTVAKSATAM